MRLSVFLTGLGLLSSKSVEGIHQAPLFTHTESIQLSHEHPVEDEVIDKRNLHGRRTTGNGTDTETQPTGNGTDTGTQPSGFGVPKVSRELFPHDIQLKAHSQVNLQEYDPQLFAETTNFLTPCLQQAFTNQLQAYKLTVEYSDGPDATDAGVIITQMTFNVVLSIVTDTLDVLKSITHESASKVVHTCFAGPRMYDYLGSLRRAGVQVNEITFLDIPFQSPIFSVPSAVMSNGEGSSMEEPKNSRAGLIATLSVGLVVLGAVFLAHRKGKLPAVQIPTNKLGHLGASIRNTATAGKKTIGRVSNALKEKFHQSSFGSDKAHSGEENSSTSEDSQAVRERTLSGSFRRHPPGGVRPAALQREPAFSHNFLKSPSRSLGNETYSLSVGDDYNVPDEYDFQGTPVSQIYGGRSPSKQSDRQPSSNGDEFSMPEDYNTVHEDMSHYSRYNASMMSGSRFTANGDVVPSPPGGRTSLLQSSRAAATRASSAKQPERRSNPFASPASTPPSSAGSVRQSPKDNAYLDEWSMASFATSPSGGTADLVAPDATPPYRHWDVKKPDGSPGSRLAMPRLS